MKLLAPAKINLFLEVVNRRPDGYHNIESIFQAVSLYDTITISPAPERVTFKCNWKNLPSDERNIAFRAALLLKKEYGVKKGACITLKKCIPLGAGLGGGSSDAAAVLKGLVKLWKLRIPEKELTSLAKRLGADVPFFLRGGTAVVRGIGERVRPMHGMKPAYFVLVYPRIAVPTAGVYKKLHLSLTNKQKITKIKKLLVTDSTSRQWSGYLFNRLEEAVLPVYPRIRQVKRLLTSLGYPCLMSGSGSTVFALVGSPADGRGLCKKLKKYRWDIRFVKTVL